MTPEERGNKDGRLEEALRSLVAAQANLVNAQANLANSQAGMIERFARIDERLSRIETILIHHQQTLDKLSEDVRTKIGFKPPGAKQ